jgi:hypothetical protein
LGLAFCYWPWFELVGIGAGKRIGSGVAQYDSGKAKEAAGQKGGKALIHYDYLFIGD